MQFLGKTCKNLTFSFVEYFLVHTHIHFSRLGTILTSTDSYDSIWQQHVSQRGATGYVELTTVHSHLPRFITRITSHSAKAGKGKNRSKKSRRTGAQAGPSTVPQVAGLLIDLKSAASQHHLAQCQVIHILLKTDTQTLSHRVALLGMFLGEDEPANYQR